MKTFTLLLGFVFLFPVVGLSQAASDSTRKPERQRQHRFIDENGDGIQDRPAGQQKRLRKGMDRFVDTNGDGISDDRECGLGIRRGKVEAGEGMKKGAGRKGPGAKQ